MWRALQHHTRPNGITRINFSSIQTGVTARHKTTLDTRAFFDGFYTERPEAVADEIPEEHQRGRAPLCDQVLHTGSGHHPHDDGIDDKSRPSQQSKPRCCRSVGPIAPEGETIIEEVVGTRAEHESNRRRRCRRHSETANQQDKQHVLDRGRNTAHGREAREPSDMTPEAMARRARRDSQSTFSMMYRGRRLVS